MIVSSLGALAALGYVVTGGGGGPDVERRVARPLAVVYAGYERLFDAGRSSAAGIGASGRHHTLDIAVTKQPERAIDYLITLDGKQVLAMTLTFSGAGEETEVTGDLDVEQALVRFAAAQGGGRATHLPDFAADYALREMIGKIAVAIEQDRPADRDMLFPLLRRS